MSIVDNPMPKSPRKTELRERRFVAEYMQNGNNAQRAYKSISPLVSDKVANVKGSQMVARDSVKKKIEEYLPSDYILASEIHSAIVSKPKKAITWNDKHNFITTALKLKGYINNSNKGNTDIKIGLVINKD